MSELLVEQDGAVLTVTFSRPDQRNAMTFAMYEGLYRRCEEVDAADGVRVLVLRGAGGRAFVAGTVRPLRAAGLPLGDDLVRRGVRKRRLQAPA